jgi:DNA-binding response OmpR family regulator
MLLKSMLERENFQVDTVMDGDAAVKITATKHYDMVLMDGFMPIKTGWQATEEIRAREKAQEAAAPGKALVILGVTGATTTEDAAKCLLSGMTDVVAKPIERRTLRAKIRKWCAGAASAHLSTPTSGESTPAARREPRKRKVLCLGKEAEALKDTLSIDEFEVVTCGGAYEVAAGGIRAEEYQIVILDVALQNKHIWDALVHVRADPSCRIVVVGVCERRWTGNMASLAHIGVYEVLPVPASEGALYGKIMQLRQGALAGNFKTPSFLVFV